MRYPELDALRGLAAVVVVVFHYLVMWHSPTSFDTGTRMLLYPVVAGHEAVVLFFLLSGFVLALPLLAGNKAPYPRFAMRRVVRIYGPYLAALILAVTGAYLWHRPDGFSRWSGKTWSEPVSPHLLLQHVLFLGNYASSQFNLAFWSLITELRISLIFPWLSSETVEYIGVFMCGILLARHIEDIRVVFSGIKTTGRAVILIGSLLLYHEGHHLADLPFVWRLSEWPTVIGAAGFIALGINTAILRRRVFQFLGRISYSMYLMHGTVLFTFAALFGNRFSKLSYLLPYLAVCVTLSFLFWAAVENPFLRLSRLVRLLS